MPISVNSFRQAGAADAAARLRLTADGARVVVKATGFKGRAVAWLKEDFGGGEAARLMTAAENEALATALADLGNRAPARAMIQELVGEGNLLPAGADALLRPDSPERA